MSWTGSSPLAVMREGMWGLMLFTAASWLAIGWSVLRLEPSDLVAVAGAVVLFGALTEVLRACAGTRTWWLNAGLAVLFAATSVLLLSAQETSYTTPVALIGWYLMVRGTVDIAVAVMTRDSDRVWGLLMVVGVLEAGLGFFAASPLSRTADLVVTIVGGLGLLRAVADLVTALRIREVRAAARSRVLGLPPGRAASLAAYTAGLTDYESVPARGRPRHRAATSAPGPSAPGPSLPNRAVLLPDQAVRPDQAVLPDRTVLSDRGALSRVRSGSKRWSGSGPEIGLESAPRIGPGPSTGSEPTPGIGSGPTPGSQPTPRIESGPGAGSGLVPVIGPGDEIRSGSGSGRSGSMWPGGPAAASEATAGGGTAADVVPGGVSAAGGMAAAGYVAASGPGRPAVSFHEEVVRTTADLDAMLALAGMTGAGVGAHLGGLPNDHVAPEVPDTPEGVESPAGAAPRDDAHPARRAIRDAATGAWRGPHAEPDGGLPIRDQTKRAAQDAGVGVDDTSTVAGVRRSD